MLDIKKFLTGQKEELPPQDKYNKLKIQYCELSFRKYAMSTKPKDVEKMEKEVRGNINRHIKKLQKEKF